MSTSEKTEHAATGKLARLWLMLLAALPIITALVSFRTDGQFAIWQLYARQLWLPAQIFELATIILAFVLGASVWKTISSANKVIKISGAIWLASMILAAFFAKIPNLALLSLVFWIMHVLFAIAIAHLLCRWPIDVRWNDRITNWISMGSAAFGVLMVFFVALVGIDADYDWVSALPGFPNIRHSGYFLMPAMALSIGMIAVGDRKAKTVHVLLLAFNLAFVSWIGSRGPLLILATTIALSICLFSPIRKRSVLWLILLAIVSGCMLSQAVPAPKHPAFNAIMRIEQDNSQNVDELSSGRTEIWRGTVTAISERPLFGHGGNQFRLLVPAAQQTYNHPHNSILQFVFDWGVVGAAAMLVMLTILGWKSLRIAIKMPENWMPTCLAAISMALFSLIDGVFYYNLPIVLFLSFAFAPLIHRLTPEKLPEIVQ